MSVLTVRDVSKRFGAVQALAHIDLDFDAGEIHCLLGENGAGKSTLMHILDGVIAADSGSILVEGDEVHITSPRAASAVGIGMVHQHFTLVDAMTVAENLALSVPGAGGWRLDRAAIGRETQAFAERIGLDMPPSDQLVRELSVGARQRLEILKALLAAGKILILDEPTAVLTPPEVQQLFVMLRQLRAENRLVIFITHKLREVKEIADRVTILRRGRVVATHHVADVSETALAEEMIGTTLATRAPTVLSSAPRAVAVEMRGISASDAQAVPALVDVDMQVGAGEIFGVAGVDGNGQRELFEILVGLRAPSAGQICVAGQSRERLTPQSAHAAGIASIPPDRQREGLALPLSVAENFLLSASVLQRFTHRGFLDHREARKYAARVADSFAIRFARLDQAVRGLSGGNQQRIVVARELSQEPRVVVAVNPTRGLDVQAAGTVVTALRAAATRGCAVVLISTDLDELLELSHRLAVLFRGHLSSPLAPPFDIHLLGQLMAGANSGANPSAGAARPLSPVSGTKP